MSTTLAESRIHTAASAVPDIAEGSDYVRCPGCGYRHRDLYEHGLEDGQTGAVECGCGHTFEITCRVSITYTVEEASHG